MFRHAVASFDPDEDRVILWTRLSGATAEATLLVGLDPSLREVVHRSEHRTGPGADQTIVVDVDGLEPGTSYWYRFEAAGQRSPVGRTRTLPVAPTDRFRIGLVSCARYSVAPLSVYRALAEREVDLVVHLGDYMYEDAGDKGPRSHDPPRRAVTLADYRLRLGQMRSDPDTQSLHLRHPVMTIWDDHDLADNAWRTGAKAHDPAEDGDWDERVLAAARARREWLPSRGVTEAAPLVTWRSMRIGDLAELVLLDTRLAGRDRHAGDDEGRPLDDPDRSLLGGTQREWVRERLRDDEARWTLVASGVVVNELELPWPRLIRPVNALLPNGYAVIDDRVIHDDQWDGYPAERRRLTRWIGEKGARGGRTVLLSGDVHSSWAFVGPADEGGEPVAVEMTVPAVSSAALGRAHNPGLSVLLDRAVRRMDHVAWAEVTRRGYGLLDLTPARAQSEWWFVQPYDDDPVASAELGAAFATEHDVWPPRFDPAAGPTADPARPGLPEPLPARPDDLVGMRRHHRARIAAESAIPLLLLAAIAGGAAWGVRGLRAKARS